MAAAAHVRSSALRVVRFGAPALLAACESGLVAPVAVRSVRPLCQAEGGRELGWQAGRQAGKPRSRVRSCPCIPADVRKQRQNSVAPQAAPALRGSRGPAATCGICSCLRCCRIRGCGRGGAGRERRRRAASRPPPRRGRSGQAGVAVPSPRLPPVRHKLWVQPKWSTCVTQLLKSNKWSIAGPGPLLSLVRTFGPFPRSYWLYHVL